MATANPTVSVDRHRAVLGLAIAAACVTILLTGVAFWLSYEALHDLATGHHLTGPRAWAWPATLDAFVIVGELLVLRSSLLGRIDWFAIALVASGSVGSIVLNVVSVGAAVDRTTQVVAAIPPTAALLAFTALMRQIYRALAGGTSPSPRPGRRRSRLAARRQAVSRPLTPVTRVVLPVPPKPATPPALPVAYTDPRLQIIRALYRPGYRPATGEIRDALTAAGHLGQGGAPLSDGWIRGARLGHIEKNEPHLAA